MAWYDSAFTLSWPNAAVAVGVMVLAPVLLPAVGYVVRPLIKGVVKAGLTARDLAAGFVEETGEQLSDLVAEAKAEHYARPEA
jgi:Protein of unknown function (DUF5132)